MTPTRLLLSAATAAFAAGFAALAVLRHLAYSTGRFDLGNMTQAVWSTAHGRFLERCERAQEIESDQLRRMPVLCYNSTSGRRNRGWL